MNGFPGAKKNIVILPSLNLVNNTVRKIRENLLMSKAELARKAGISPLTLDRIEKGMSCRIETKRKIVLAFGYDLSDKGLIFKG
jgi:DNA-binding XRE family transcriptional regulator